MWLNRSYIPVQKGLNPNDLYFQLLEGKKQPVLNCLVAMQREVAKLITA